MLIGVFQTAVTLLAMVAFYATDSLLLRKYDRLRANGKSGRNWVNTIASLIAVALLLLQPMIWPPLSLRVYAGWGLVPQIVGLVLVVGAAGLNLWARIHLGEFFVQRAEVQEDHCLVDSGPYAYMRHPIFASYFGTLAGLMLVNPSITLLGLAFPAIWYFTDQARQDEQLLGQHLPEYATYMERVPRYLPRLSSTKLPRPASGHTSHASQGAATSNVGAWMATSKPRRVK